MHNMRKAISVRTRGIMLELLSNAARQGDVRFHLRSNLGWQGCRKGDVGEPVLDDVVRAKIRTRRLLPPQRTLAYRADETPDALHVRRVEVMGASLILTDGSFDPVLPAIGRRRSPVRRVTSKQNRSTIGATSVLM